MTSAFSACPNNTSGPHKMANIQRVMVTLDEFPHLTAKTVVKIMINAGDISYFETIASTGINMHPATRRQLRAVDASIGGMRWESPSSDDPEDEDIPAPAAGKASSANKRRSKSRIDLKRDTKRLKPIGSSSKKNAQSSSSDPDGNKDVKNNSIKNNSIKNHDVKGNQVHTKVEADDASSKTDSTSGNQAKISKKKTAKILKRYDSTKEMRTADWARLQRAVRQLSDVNTIASISELQEIRVLARERNEKPSTTLEFLLLLSPYDTESESDPLSSSKSDDSDAVSRKRGSRKPPQRKRPTPGNLEEWNAYWRGMDKDLDKILATYPV